MPIVRGSLQAWLRVFSRRVIPSCTVVVLAGTVGLLGVGCGKNENAPPDRSIVTWHGQSYRIVEVDSSRGELLLENVADRVHERINVSRAFAVKIAGENAKCIEAEEAKGKSIKESVEGCRDVFDASHKKRAEFVSRFFGTDGARWALAFLEEEDGTEVSPSGGRKGN